MARGMPGQIEVGRIVRQLLKDSEILDSHRNRGKVQDAYSLRCMPQVHDTVRDAIGFARSILEIEINGCTDNPLVSMSCHAAQNAMEIIENISYILAIELPCACQAIDLKRPLKTSEPLEKIHRLVREKFFHLSSDRIMCTDMEMARRLIVERRILEIAGTVSR